MRLCDGLPFRHVMGSKLASQICQVAPKQLNNLTISSLEGSSRPRSPRNHAMSVFSCISSMCWTSCHICVDLGSFPIDHHACKYSRQAPTHDIDPSLQPRHRLTSTKRVHIDGYDSTKSICCHLPLHMRLPFEGPKVRAVIFLGMLMWTSSSTR